MNCREVLNRLYDIIDNEPSDIDKVELQAHLDECSHCLKRYKLEDAIHRLVVRKCTDIAKSEQISDSCRQNILCRLKEAAEQEEVRKSADSRSSFRLWRNTLAIAATLVILFGGGYVGYQIYLHNDRYLPIEKLHWAVDDHSDSYSMASFATALAGVRDQFDYLMQDNVGSFNLVGSRKDSLAGLEMEHFVYSNDTTTVSVFVVDAAQFKLPPDIEEARVVREGKEYFDHNCRGCHVLYHPEGKAMIITATRDHSIDLFSFVPGHIGI